jgi:uncharacterized membrane protein
MKNWFKAFVGTFVSGAVIAGVAVGVQMLAPIASTALGIGLIFFLVVVFIKEELDHQDRMDRLDGPQ